MKSDDDFSKQLFLNICPYFVQNLINISQNGE
ncbi:hypothetical protein E9O_00709 [Moraxella catarrhalis 12P80B1]|nr:hypothetical protein E9G_07730 [Moraxella catarrhalis 7169]EGE17413.1 hypothetical protein E9O_00709 [Moraxella catarrhalis 12P80B1]EGE26016.1 hypothetical protein EA1_05818 [Moraxella catarrhalis O35E]